MGWFENGRLGMALAAALCSAAPPAMSQERTCPDVPMLSVIAATDAAATICDAVARARPLLAACGLVQTRRITIEVRSQIAGVGDHCAGIYFTGTDRIAVIPRSRVVAVMPLDSAFASLDPGVYYDSLIVHELSHALMEQAQVGSAFCAAEQEYVAYAMQIGSLPEAARRTLISFRKIDRPVPQSHLNDLILGMTPDVFALMAWSHFDTTGNGCPFIRKILRGETSLALPYYP